MLLTLRVCTCLFVFIVLTTAALAQEAFLDAGNQIRRYQKSQGQTFIENRGQWDARARYLTRLPGVDAWVTDRGIVYDFYRNEESPANSPALTRASATASRETPSRRVGDHRTEPPHPNSLLHRRGHVVEMRFVSSSDGEASASPVHRADGHHNYFLGSDPKRWATNVGLFEEVQISRIYEGIDARVLFDDGSLRYDLVVAPNADPSRIAIAFDGADRVRVDGTGDLIIGTSIGDMKQGALVAYQMVLGTVQRVPCRFAVDNRGNIGFVLGAYDRSRPLVIDPTLWSRYFGTSAEESGGSLAVDSVGNVYFTGATVSAIYPTRQGNYDVSYNGKVDGVVTRLNRINGSIGYSTYIGGANDEWPGRIAIDDAGCAYVALLTLSTDFPLTQFAFDVTYNGPLLDAAVFKLDRGGNGLVFSTRLGGTGAEDALDISVTPTGGIYVSGTTGSTDFPTTVGALHAQYQGGPQDGFVTRLTADGQRLSFSTFVGGSAIDVATSVAVDSIGSVYVAGYTESVDFPTTPGSIQTVLNGPQDAFVMKINPEATALMYSTFIGGTAHEGNAYLEVDRFGDVYMAGQTGSTDFHITHGAFETIFASMYAMRINSFGTAVHYATFFGGTTDKVFSVALARAGFFCITGFTTSSRFPTSADALSRTYAGGPADAFVTIVRPSGATLSYSSYLGGSANDVGYGIGLDRRGDVYVAGYTTSPNFPVVNSTHNGGTDLFVTNIERCFVTASAGPDRTICQGDSVFIGTLSARGIPPYTYQWESDGPAAIDDPDTAQMWVKPTVTTTYVVTSLDAIGCDDVDTVIITVNNPPIAFAGPDTAFCIGSSVKIGAPAVSGTPPHTYAWLPAAGLSSTSIAAPIARPDTATEYIVTVTDAKGCKARDTVVVRPNAAPVLEPGGTYEICARDTATIGVSILSGVQPYTYRWVPATGLSSATAATPKAFPTATTTYRVTVTDSNGCSTTSTPITVTVGASLRTRINPIGSLKLCPGDSVTLDPGEFAQYQWTNGSTSRTIRVGDSGTYSVGITSTSGCIGRSDTVRVTFGERVDSGFTGATTVCQGAVAVYTTNAGPSATFKWRLAGSAGQIVSETAGGELRARWSAAVRDTVFLVVTSRDGCRDSSFMVVTVTPALKPVISQVPQVAFCPGDSIELDAGASFVRYRWSDGTTSQKIKARASGKYWVEVEDAGGCIGWSDTLDVQVRVAPAPEITALGTQICPGDTAVLIATAGFASYRWSNGATTDRVNITTAGVFNVTVTDANGCVGTSADVAIVVHRIPTAPTITVADDTLISSPASTYQWSRDGVVINNAVEQRFVRTLSGLYSVVVTDANGCRSQSSIQIDERRNVWVDTASANVGDRVRLGFIVSPGLSAANGVDKYSVRLKLDPRDLFAHGVHSAAGTPAPTMVVGADGSVVVSYAGTQVVTGDTLFKIELQGLSTARPVSVVRVDSVSIARSGETLIAGNGLVLLAGCDVGQFATGKRVSIIGFRRADNDQIVIGYRAPEGSHPSMRLFDASGMLIGTVQLDGASDLDQEASFSVPASGFYIIEIRDRDERIALPVLIAQ